MLPVKNSVNREDGVDGFDVSRSNRLTSILLFDGIFMIVATLSWISGNRPEQGAIG
jgi:hypothetical protein